MSKKNNIDKAYDILKEYKGVNNRILYLQKMYSLGKCILGDFDVEYILNNYDYEPYAVGKTVKITRDFGLKLQQKYELDFLPEKIKISTVIGEMGNSLHCFVKYRQSVPSQLMYVSKNSILNELEDVDWKTFEVDFSAVDKKRPLREHQKEGVQFLLANKKCILADSMGLGKLQDLDTITPTPNGFVRFGDLKVGDKVFASNGKECEIQEIFPHKEKDIYEIEFTDGSKTNSGLEHLWIVQTSNHIRRKQGWQVLSLQQILDYGLEWNSVGHHNYKFRIPIAKPVEYCKKEYFIHPYLLGMLIGDGNLCNSGVRISIPNSEIESVERLNLLLNENYHFTIHKTASCPQYNIVGKTVQRVNLYNREIKRLKLNVHGKDKFIPQEYLLGSVEQRKELLKGLMDSDGSISKERNKISFSTTSKKLAEDFCVLVQSLGGLATIHTYDRTSQGKSVEYNIGIQVTFCPFKLERKCKRYTIDSTHHKYLVKSIKSVKFLKKADAMCIKVNSEDESYLTNNFIVTHNTTTSISAAILGNFKKVLIITTASLKTTWRKEIEIFEDKENIQVINGSEWKSGYKFTIVNYDIAQRFYEVAEEIAYEYKEMTNSDGTVSRVKVPITVRNKSTGQLEYKMKKSRKKDDIKEALKKSPLFLEQFDCVIIDEAHKLSNPKAKRYQVIEDFLKKSKIPYVFLLTGTPITKDTVRFYYVLKLLDANITKDYMFYMRRFCGAKKRTFNGRELLLPTEATHLDELKEKVKNIYIRRELKDMADMVKKTVSTRYYDLSPKQMGEYDKLWSDYTQSQQENGGETNEDYKQLVEGMLVRQYLANQMVENTIKLIDEKIEDDEKVVVMCTFTDELQKFKDHYGAKCVTYDGHMTSKAKDKAFEKFQNDKKVKVFVGNIVAASVGLSLTAAHTLIFNSYSWVFADNNQAEDRIYRLTSTDDVEIIYQLFTDSISEHMYRTVMEKQRILNETIKKESEK
jgi:hypothetical protein